MAITAEQMVKKMNRGINLGQTFDANNKSRELWRTGKLLDAWWAKGLKHVRIPVTWNAGSTAGCRLNDATFMKQLKDTVDYAVRKGFVVELNAHHENWLYEKYDLTETYNGKFWQFWQDVALYFNYLPQDQLVLELLNEPQGPAFGNWTGDVDVRSPEAIARTRRIFEVGWAGVRRISGTRVVAISTNGMGSCGSLDFCYPTKDTLPGSGKDKYLLMHVHSYDPWACCGEDGNWGSYLSKTDPLSALKADIGARYDKVVAWRTKLGGMPVTLGEYGVGRKEGWKRDNDITRAHYKYTAQACLARGIAPTIWCDGEDSWYGLHKLSNGTVQFIYGLLDAALSTTS